MTRLEDKALALAADPAALRRRLEQAASDLLPACPGDGRAAGAARGTKTYA